LVSVLSVVSLNTFAATPGARAKTAAEVNRELESTAKERKNESLPAALKSNDVTVRKTFLFTEVGKIAPKVDVGLLGKVVDRSYTITDAAGTRVVTGESIVRDLVLQMSDIIEMKKAVLAPDAISTVQFKESAIQKSLEYLEKMGSLSDSNATLAKLDPNAQLYVDAAIKQAVLTTRLSEMSQADAQLHVDFMVAVVAKSNDAPNAAQGKADVAFRKVQEERTGSPDKAREATRKVVECE
jgi:hypothetical protein